MGFGSELHAAWAASEQFAAAAPHGSGRIIVAGLGGSAGAADLAGAIAGQRGWDGVTVVRRHELPWWAGRSDLIVICSYGGGTRETLLAFDEALARGLPVCVITAGETLARLARARRVPVFQVTYEAPPRHSLAWLVAPILRLAAARAGDTGLSIELAGTCPTVDACVDPRSGGVAEMARFLSASMLNRFVVVTGAEYLAPVARRWKNQLNENGKHVAFAEELPEAAHNSVEAGCWPPGNLLHVVLAGQAYSRPAAAVTGSYANTLRTGGLRVERVAIDGMSPLAETLAQVALGDLVSLYLADMKGIDPLPIERIAALKEETSRAWRASETAASA